MAVGLGIAEIGDAAPARQYGEKLLREIKVRIDSMIINAVERMRVSPEKIPVLAVGGGSILIPERVGDLPVIKPENFAVANAVGAAIGQISGEVDRIFSLASLSRRKLWPMHERRQPRKLLLLEQNQRRLNCLIRKTFRWPIFLEMQLVSG